MERILKSFLKRLTNISSSNRSVCLLKLYREQFFDLHRLDFLYKLPSFQIIEQLISGKKKLFLCDELDSRDEIVNEISKNLRKISRREKLLFEESGAKDLYVGWPFVHGKLSDGSIIRCPLLFFPVNLLLENSKWHIQQRGDSEVTLNKNFLLAYAHFNSVPISDEWIESSFDDFDKNPTAFRTALYEFIKTGPLELNFNQELFTDRLNAFKEYKTEDYNSVHENGVLKLYPEAVLGIFPQAGSYLVPDYEELISKNEHLSLEDFFKSRLLNNEESKIKEESNYLVFETDASQEEAIVKIKEGSSMVVQGPPGTGKSQLICNLISDFTARGKKVLLVCQKKAALDVVHERLKTKDVHAFSALVHDFRNDRTKIFEQVSRQINSVENNQKLNNGLDTIYLERTFTQASRQIRHSQEELDNFKTALFNVDDFGISAKELYLTSSPHGEQIDLKEFATRFSLESSINFERKIKNFMPYASLFMKEAYLWQDRVSFENYYQRDMQSIIQAIEKIPLYKEQLHASASRQLKSGISRYTLNFFIDNTEAASKINELIKDEDEYFLLLQLMNEKADSAWLEGRKKKILNCFEDQIPENTLSIEELEECEKKLNKYIEVRGSFLKGLYWNLFSVDKAYLKKVFKKNELVLSLEGAEKLIKRIILRKKFEKERSNLSKKNWAKSFPKGINKEKVESWFKMYFRVREAVDIIISSQELTMLTDHSGNDYKIFSENFQLIPVLASDVQLNYQEWSRYLTPKMIQGILNTEYESGQLQKILSRDFDRLVAFDKLKKEMLAYESQIMNMLVGHNQSVSEEEKGELFRNSIRLQWLEYLEEKYPILRSVSDLSMNQLERVLQESINDKTAVSKDILLLRLREGSYKNIEFNRLQNRVTYRDLYHQVTKKKKLWPLRRLINEYSNELFDLIPCWMASPESVSALFPLKDIFDLVIFDEASQCFSEQGLPAMHRGKQVVIAGDSKQLKPNDLYQARWEDESDDSPDLEIDSLLDLSEKYLPSTQLNGHYRSRNLDLIDFSNRYFYNQSLELVPYFEDINKQEPSIKYIPVKGIWENNTNPEEALSVVNLVINLLKKEERKSIGVVTFNFKQAQLILDLLEEQAVLQKVLIPENLFVKNIENVQGDEKDIIIFSIGYAPDTQGKFTMQFGSLNQEGGQNRLNVAITRAREKICLVASILPQQLSVEDSIHDGPRLLKRYLEYAWEVSEGLYKTSVSDSGKHSRDWYLRKKIAESSPKDNYTFCEELPFADITVKNSNKYYALICTDDDQYFNARNSKETHAYKPLQLKKKGWKCRRIFSREYWLHQNDLWTESPDI
jgi:superfamily I DNA and/or RNA helicase